MMLADLLVALETQGALPRSRIPAITTNLTYFASALGYPNLAQCPVAACGDPATWLVALETHWRTLEAAGRTISVYTRRNTRSDIRQVFRLAGAHGLLTAPPPPLLVTSRGRRAFQRQQQETTPYPSTYRPKATHHRFTLPQAEWPPDIQAGWQDYLTKCGFRLRPTTVQSYTTHMATYLGYLVNIAGRTPTWADCFDRAQLMEFVRWHGARMGGTVSSHGRHVVALVAAMATVLKRPDARELGDLRNSVKPPPPLHNKQEHMVSLADLEQVAESCLAEGRSPYLPYRLAKHPGARRAVEFQRGVILKLLVRVPLRSRNVREMQLRRHLVPDHEGHWWLRFRGDDLKVGERRGRVNEFSFDLTAHYPEFIPVLEEWLTVYRPRLPNATTSNLCFLTQRGKQHSMQTLHHELAYVVARQKGRRFYPHLIRTIWPTEYLTDDDAPDWTTAAVMLGDKVATVMTYYHDLVDQEHHPKASAFLAKKLRTG